MIVLDNSVLVAALVADANVGAAAQARIRDEGLVAPALIDIEALSALRGLVQGGKLTSERARLAVEALGSLPIERFSHGPLVRRVWELRESLTAYDAAYVALAETVGAPLVTCDRWLADAPGIRCVVELIS